MFLKINGDLFGKKHMGMLKSKSAQFEEVFGTEHSKLEEVKRLATIGQVASMAGHDLRNPLQTMVYAIYNAEEEIKNLPEETKEVLEDRGFIDFFEKLKKQLNYMNKIVTDLQDYATMTKLELYETDLQRLIKDTLESVGRPENVTVKVEVDPTIGPIRVDPQLMKRVFLCQSGIKRLPGDAKRWISRYHAPEGE